MIFSSLMPPAVLVTHKGDIQYWYKYIHEIQPFLLNRFAYRSTARHTRKRHRRRGFHLEKTKKQNEYTQATVRTKWKNQRML